MKERGLEFQSYEIEIRAEAFRAGDKPVRVYTEACSFSEGKRTGPAVYLTRKQAERLGRWMLQAAKEKTK